MNRPGIYRILTIEALYLPPENNTPEYRLYPEGIIRITGRGINETKKEVSDKIMKWIDNYLLDPADVTYVIISFEYLNSSSTAILVSIIKKISGVRLMMKKAVIRWYYEEDDEDILERGEYISAAFNIPVEFIAVSDISSVPDNFTQN